MSDQPNGNAGQTLPRSLLWDTVAGEQLFEFASFDDWHDGATRRFQQAAVSAADVVCLDARNRICGGGMDFIKARHERSFPIKVYRIRKDS